MSASEATHSIATVFGGSGFIGRYVVQRLARRGYVVRVAVRDPEGALFLKPMGEVGQIVPLYSTILNDATVQRAVEGAAFVVNLVGILAEKRRGDFDRVHHEGGGRVARLAQAAGTECLVHLSAIGANPASRSNYASTKAHGEQAVRMAFPNATILRPSIVFGPEDQFFNRFASLAQMLPFMPVIAGASRFQPVYVGDVADAVLAAQMRPDAAGATYELGGPRIWTFEAILKYILAETRRRRPLVRVPLTVARLQAGILEHLPGKLLTRDQLRMLGHDNVVTPGMPGLPELGIVPTPVELVVPAYLRRFRPGGGKREILPEELKGTKADLPP